MRPSRERLRPSLPAPLKLLYIAGEPPSQVNRHFLFALIAGEPPCAQVSAPLRFAPIAGDPPSLNRHSLNCSTSPANYRALK
jgi:hypothetical protein